MPASGTGLLHEGTCVWANALAADSSFAHSLMVVGGWSFVVGGLLLHVSLAGSLRTARPVIYAAM